MEEKLKSISRRIHWSLVLKAAVFSLGWFFLPYWAFVLLAAGLYLSPFFRSGNLAPLFLTLLLLAAIQPRGFLMAALFGGIFYAILLIKGFLLIDRRAAREFVVLALSFLVLRAFYMHFNDGITGIGLFTAFLSAAIIAFIFRGFLNAIKDELLAKSSLRSAATWLSFLLFAEIIMAVLFLPLDFIYQATISFLFVVLAIDLIPQHLSGSLTRNKVLMAATTVFSLLVILFSSARWSL